MKTFKVKDLFIIKPVKLVKESKHWKFEFPYNILYKLGLLEVSSYSRIAAYSKMGTFIGDIKYKINKQLPKHVGDSALLVTQKYYVYDSNDLTLAVVWEKDYSRGYADIFTKKIYKPNFSEIYPRDKNKLVLDDKLVSSRSLAYYLSSMDCDKTFEESQEKYYEIMNREYSLEDLKKIREDIIANEDDILFTKKIEKTQVFIDYGLNRYSYNAKGEIIYPKTNVKIKKKIVHKHF